MADTKISALTGASTPLAGTEVLPIVQSGATVKVSVANLTAGRAVSATALTMSTGSLVPSTAGQGVNFTANTAAAGMTSQLLNWYEEGTWTPNLAVGFTVVGALTVSGTYTRIGRTVFVRGTIQAATSITSAGGNTRITGFPFTSSSSTAVVFVQDNLAYPGTGFFQGTSAGLYNPAYSASSNTVIFTFTYLI
jgi:hypothetical protein